jgi:molybdate transport system substrate-binding protein
MKCRFIVGMCLASIFLFSACTPQATQPATTLTQAASTTAPTAKPTQPPAVTLHVFAAASLTASFGEIGKAFEAKHPGVTVTFNFAGSQQLGQQINAAAPADVFASANQTQMDAVVKSGRIDQGASKPFVNNRLVVIYPKANPAGIQTLQDLAKPGVKLVLADKSVPVGQYALNFLDNAVKDATFGASYKDDVLKNVVSYELDVKSVLTKVTLGEADAGIVYTTDAATDTAGKTSQLAIPDSLNVIAVYPIAVIKDSPNLSLAQALVDFVLSPDGQAILTKYGFIPIK